MFSWFARYLLLLLPVTGWAQVVLDFDDLTFSDYDSIAASYGDGLDAHIPDVQYATLNASDLSLFESHLELWHNDYGNLVNVAYPSSDGLVAQITFVPEVGYGVNLISFEMAGYFHVDRTNSIMRILDGDGNVLLDFASGGAVVIEGDAIGSLHSTFNPDLTHEGTLVIQWGTDWDVGIDNIQFQSVAFAAIPEPSTLVLLTFGGICLLAGRPRRLKP